MKLLHPSPPILTTRRTETRTATPVVLPTEPQPGGHDAAWRVVIKVDGGDEQAGSGQEEIIEITSEERRRLYCGKGT